MNLYLKHPQALEGDYQVVYEDFFSICPYFPGPSVTGLCWEYDIIEKIRKNEDGYFDFSKSIIDIGSEDGSYAMLLNFNKNYCFEPNKQMCCLIYTNMYLKDKVDNTFVYNVFLGDKEESVVYDGFSSTNSVNFIVRQRADVTNVNTHTLDEYNINNVGFIKTDTEGFDYFVIKGGIGTIIRNDYPPILFENWPINTDLGGKNWTKEDYDKMNNLLIGLGYEILEYWGNHETHLAIKKK